MIHSDSVSRAFERRMAFSRMRERMTSASVGLGAKVRYLCRTVHKLAMHTVLLRMQGMPLVRTL
jgi:hypothetical protein